MNEGETLNRSFTIILAVHQPYSITDRRERRKEPGYTRLVFTEAITTSRIRSGLARLPCNQNVKKTNDIYTKRASPVNRANSPRVIGPLIFSNA